MGGKSKCVNNASEAILLPQIEEIWDRLRISNDLAEQLSARLSTVNENLRSINEAQKKKLNEECLKLENRKTRMYYDKLDGSITTEEYDKYVSDTEEALHEARLKLEMPSRVDTGAEFEASYLLELSEKQESFLKVRNLRKNDKF